MIAAIVLYLLGVLSSLARSWDANGYQKIDAYDGAAAILWPVEPFAILLFRIIERA